jgi:hypothetical protein
LCGVLGKRGQVHGLVRVVATAVEGQLDELVDEVAQLAGLALDVVHQPIAPVGRQVADAAQHAGPRSGSAGAASPVVCPLSIAVAVDRREASTYW